MCCANNASEVMTVWPIIFIVLAVVTVIIILIIIITVGYISVNSPVTVIGLPLAITSGLRKT